MTSTTLYLEHFQLSRDPFDQDLDTSIFFPVRERNTILKNLVADFDKGKLLIKLTGSEGTGKTLMCRLLEESINRAKYQLVSIEHPIGSYDNFLRTVCLALGTGTTDEENEEDGEVIPDYAILLIRHLQRIDSEGRSLILLVDEAEHLFLATLERLIRLLCDTENIRNLYIVLVGRLELDVTLDQLAIYCSNVDVNTGYTLEALSLEETKQYIRFRLQGAEASGNNHLEIFTDDAIEMIFQSAMGNISLTNSLAEQGLKRACEQGMFQVDEELIQTPQGIEENVSLAVFQGYDFVRDHKWWLLAGIVFVWGILMVLWPAGDQQEEGRVVDEQLEIITPEQEIVVPPDPVKTEFVVSDTIPEFPEIDEPEEIAMVEAEQLMPKSEREETASATESVIDVFPLEQKASIPDNKTLILEPEKIKKVVIIPSPAPEEKIEVSSRDKKKLAAAPPPPKEEKTVKPSREEKKVVIIQPPPKEEKIEKSSKVADALFEERVRASSSWLAWGYRGGYTIQLMVLASENAEENLKKILVDDKYYAVRNDLYILKKRSPKTFYVFHGNYPSMDTARQVRNRMPPFLRANQPYVLSIKDASEKTK